MSIRHFNRLLIQTIARHQPLINRVRLYGRWMHRNPAKVLLPFEPTSNANLKKEKVITLDPEILNKYEEETQTASEIKYGNTNRHSQETLSSAKHKEKNSKKEEKMKKRKFYLSQQKIFDDNSEIMYEKLKANDGRIRQVNT